MPPKQPSMTYNRYTCEHDQTSGLKIVFHGLKIRFS